MLAQMDLIPKTLEYIQINLNVIIPNKSFNQVYILQALKPNQNKQKSSRKTENGIKQFSNILASGRALSSLFTFSSG